MGTAMNLGHSNAETSWWLVNFRVFLTFSDRSETSGVSQNVIWMSILRLLLPKLVANESKST